MVKKIRLTLYDYSMGGSMVCNRHSYDYDVLPTQDHLNQMLEAHKLTYNVSIVFFGIWGVSE